MKYKYIGDSPLVLMDSFHIELYPGGIYDLDGEVNFPLLIPVEEEKQSKKGGTN